MEETSKRERIRKLEEAMSRMNRLCEIRPDMTLQCRVVLAILHNWRAEVLTNPRRSEAEAFIWAEECEKFALQNPLS